MNDERERLKTEIVGELRHRSLRTWRNVAVLGGLALVIGCSFGVDPLLGGIVAGSVLSGLGFAAMLLVWLAERKAKSVRKEEEKP